MNVIHTLAYVLFIQIIDYNTSYGIRNHMLTTEGDFDVELLAVLHGALFQICA